MNSKMVFGQYYYADSWIHRLDPRTKILAVIIYMIAIFLVDSLYVLLGFFGFTILILLSTKIPFGKFLKSIKMLSFLLLITFICQVLFRKTGDILITFNFTLTVLNLITIILVIILYFVFSRIIKKYYFLLFLGIMVGCFIIQYFWISGILIVNYNIPIYTDSLLSSLFLIVRLITLIFISSLLTLSTKPTELNNGLEKLLKPLNIFHRNVASILSMMVSIALRYVPTLINEANKVLKAQASRGVDFKEAKLKEKVTQIISLIVPMFIISYKRAEDLSDAMEARGYNPDMKRTSIFVLKMKYSDYIVYAFLGVSLIALIVGKVLWGI